MGGGSTCILLCQLNLGCHCHCHCQHPQTCVYVYNAARRRSASQHLFFFLGSPWSHRRDTHLGLGDATEQRDSSKGTKSLSIISVMPLSDSTSLQEPLEPASFIESIRKFEERVGSITEIHPPTADIRQEEDQALESHEVVELQAFIERKEWINEKIIVRLYSCFLFTYLIVPMVVSWSPP